MFMQAPAPSEGSKEGLFQKGKCSSSLQKKSLSERQLLKVAPVAADLLRDMSVFGLEDEPQTSCAT